MSVHYISDFFVCFQNEKFSLATADELMFIALGG